MSASPSRAQRALIYFGLAEDPRSHDDGNAGGIDWFIVASPLFFGVFVGSARDSLFGVLVAIGLLPMAIAELTDAFRPREHPRTKSSPLGIYALFVMGTSLPALIAPDLPVTTCVAIGAALSAALALVVLLRRRQPTHS